MHACSGTSRTSYFRDAYGANSMHVVYKLARRWKVTPPCGDTARALHRPSMSGHPSSSTPRRKVIGKEGGAFRLRRPASAFAI
jgi:hypothetical protein